MAAPRTYSGLQISLHWVIAALIFVQLTFNVDMQKAFAQRLVAQTLPDNMGATIHMVIGVSILALAIARLFIRTRRGVPEPQKGTHWLIICLSHMTHILLYGFIFFMPVSGALGWFAGIELAGVLHELGRLILIPAILLHVGGAMFEEIVLDRRVISRMVRTR